MSGRKAYRAFYEETTKLQQYLKKLPDNFGTKEIHQFRVSYKKVRAIVRVAAMQREQVPDLHLGHGLKRFYHTTGLIRNYQLQKQRIQSICLDLYLPEPLSYLDYIDDVLISLSARGRTELPKPKIGRLRRNMKHKLLEWDDSNLTVFFQLLLAQYQHLTLAKNPSDENIHRIRKVLKDLLYTRLLLPASGSMFISRDYDTASLQKVTVMLGDFHDLCLAIQLLDQARRDEHLQPDHKRTLCYIMDVLDHSRQSMKARVVKIISENVSPELSHVSGSTNYKISMRSDTLII